MEGYIGVEFIVPVTDCLNGGVVTLQAQQNDVNSPAGMANLVGDASATSAGDDDLNDQLLVLDIYKPTKRYIRPQVVRATANVAIGNVIARRYRARKEPTSQGSTVLDSNGLVSPAEA